MTSFTAPKMISTGACKINKVNAMKKIVHPCLAVHVSKATSEKLIRFRESERRRNKRGILQ